MNYLLFAFPVRSQTFYCDAYKCICSVFMNNWWIDRSCCPGECKCSLYEWEEPDGSDLETVMMNRTYCIPNQTPIITPQWTPYQSLGFTPQWTPDQSPDVTPEQSPDVTPDQSLGFTPQWTPDQSPDVTPEQSPGFTPEQSPEQSPGFTPEQSPGFTPEQSPYQSPGFVFIESKEQDNDLLIYIIVALFGLIILILFIIILYCCCKRRISVESSSTSTPTISIEVPKEIQANDQILSTVSVFGDDTDPFESDFDTQQFEVSDEYFLIEDEK